MATSWRSINSLRSALERIQIIERRIASTNGQLTKEVFSQSHIGNDTLDVVRESIGLNFQSVVQNVRALKRDNPILLHYPDIQRNISDSVSRCNWLSHEYATTAPVKWDDVADSIYDDLPIMKSSIIAALKANGVSDP